MVTHDKVHNFIKICDITLQQQFSACAAKSSTLHKNCHVMFNGLNCYIILFMTQQIYLMQVFFMLYLTLISFSFLQWSLDTPTPQRHTVALCQHSLYNNCLLPLLPKGSMQGNRYVLNTNKPIAKPSEWRWSIETKK